MSDTIGLLTHKQNTDRKLTLHVTWNALFLRWQHDAAAGFSAGLTLRFMAIIG